MATVCFRPATLPESDILLPTADICKRLCEEFDVTQDVVEADARRFLSELKANDILING